MKKTEDKIGNAGIAIALVVFIFGWVILVSPVTLTARLLPIFGALLLAFLLIVPKKFPQKPTRLEQKEAGYGDDAASASLYVLAFKATNRPVQLRTGKSTPDPLLAVESSRSANQALTRLGLVKEDIDLIELTADFRRSLANSLGCTVEHIKFVDIEGRPLAVENKS